MDRYDNNTTRFIKAMDRYILEHAKKLITDFCLKEYNCEGDFSNLAHISIAYTYTSDEEIPIQIVVDLVHYEMKCYLSGELFRTRTYDSLGDLAAAELEYLNFDELVSLTHWEEDQIMDYYSEVALTLKKADALGLIRKAKEDKSNAQSWIAAADSIIDQDKYVTFYWNQVTWYAACSSVQFIADFYHGVDEYSFKRVGEDYGDIEIDWGGDYDDINELSNICQCIEIAPCGKPLYVPDIKEK